MDHLFITRSGELHPHWIEVFPQAKARASFQGRPQCGAATVLWVEWPGSFEGPHSLENHSQELSNLVALGKPVVVLSPNPSDSQGQTALSLGAKGYCHSLAASAQLRDVATVVTSGGLWLGPDLLQRVLRGGISGGARPASASTGGQSQPAALNKLTKREAAVAQAAAQGLTNKEIADALDIGERTVKSHLSIVFQKLSLRDRVQLALLLNGIGSFPA